MSEEWKQGTFSCFSDIEICLCGSFCSCCLVYRNAEALGQSGPLCFLGSLLLPCLPLFCLRSEAREQFGIDGSDVDDAICACCCGPCVNCQTANEIRIRKDGN